MAHHPLTQNVSLFYVKSLPFSRREDLIDLLRTGSILTSQADIDAFGNNISAILASLSLPAFGRPSQNPTMEKSNLNV